MTATAEQLATRQERERSRLETRGVRASRAIMQDIQQSAVNAVQSGIDPAHIVKPRVDLIVPTITDALIASHLRGYYRSWLSAQTALRTRRKKAMAASVYTETINYIRQRVQMTDADLAALRLQYGQVAFAVANQASGAIERSLQTTLRNVRAENLAAREGLDRFGAAIRRNGMTAVRSNVIETMFRTQTSIGYSVGRQRANAEPEIDSILWGYQYWTVGDDRVRPTHEAMDGVRAPKDDPIWLKWMPPAGYNCRCTVTEIYFTDEYKDRSIQYPPEAVEFDGVATPVEPDEGFAVNFADVFAR